MRMLDLVDGGDSEVFRRYTTLPIRAYQQVILPDAKFAGAFSER
jgi:hypothetical protein